VTTDRMPRVEFSLRPGDYEVRCKNGHQSTLRVEPDQKKYRRCPVCGIKAFVRRAIRETRKDEGDTMKKVCNCCKRPLIGTACPEVAFQHDKALLARDDMMREQIDRLVGLLREALVIVGRAGYGADMALRIDAELSRTDRTDLEGR
jgi:hypothetical protein